MPKIVRYNGNLKAFASEQQANERTLFGQAAIANDLTSQITAQFLRGWGIVGPSDQPSLQDFNAAMYTNGQLLAYLHQMGVAEYNAAQEYFTGSLTQTGGVLYMSTVDGNIGNTPETSPVQWKAFSADQATEAALGLIKIATQALVSGGVDDQAAITSKKRAIAAQSQSGVAFTTTGTPTAQVLTPAPAITAYSANQRFSVTFSVTSGASPTINISGLGAKSLKKYDGAGAKVAASFFAGQVSDIVYDGVDFVVLSPVLSVPTATETVPGIARFGDPAEQLAGLLKTVASNPAGVLSLLTSWLPKRSFATYDFVRIPDVPGGLIIQWGRSSSPSSGNATASLSVNFPNAFILGIPVDYGFNSSGATYGSWDALLSTSSTIVTRWAASPSDYAYLAIGF